MEHVKKTPLFDSYKKYGGKIINFSGWALPVQFEGIIQEHEAVRSSAGLFDVSHMGEVKIIGKDAFEFVQNLVTNDLSKQIVNQVIYSPMCYPDGGVVDDLIVYKYNVNHYLLVINAGNIEKDFDWMLSNKGTFDIELTNISPSVSQLAIQGPKAEKILQTLTSTDLSEIKFFYCVRDVIISGTKCMISRTGYIGEDGLEIYTDNKSMVYLWDKLLESGKDLGLKPVGLGCRDTLRFEVNLPLYGNELSDTITPLEAGLSFFVKLNKENFIGKEALLKQKHDGLKKKLIGFEMKARAIPRHGYEVFADDEKIGVVTTGYFSPTLKKNLGLALVDTKYSDLGNTIFIQVRNKPYEAQIINKKFLNKKYKK